MKTNCLICQEEVEEDQGAYCSSKTSHFMCSTCAIKIARTSYAIPSSTIRCCYCEAFIEPSILFNLGMYDVYDLLERAEQFDVISSIPLHQRAFCPFCGYFYEVDYSSVDFLYCRKCHTTSCILENCKRRVVNGNHECTANDLKKKVETILNYAVSVTCQNPECKRSLDKNSDGCNRLTCTCGWTTCFICDTVLVKDRSRICDAYTHFKENYENGITDCWLFCSEENIVESNKVAGEKRLEKKLREFARSLSKEQREELFNTDWNSELLSVVLPRIRSDFQ